MFFGTLPSVAEGFQLRTWRGGPLAGQPKVPPAVRTMVERGLEIRTDTRVPKVHFSESGLAALRLLALDRRYMDPQKFAHVRVELGLETIERPVRSSHFMSRRTRPPRWLGDTLLLHAFPGRSIVTLISHTPGAPTSQCCAPDSRVSTVHLPLVRSCRPQPYGAFSSGRLFSSPQASGAEADLPIVVNRTRWGTVAMSSRQSLRISQAGAMTVTVPLDPRYLSAPSSTYRIPPLAGFTDGATEAL